MLCKDQQLCLAFQRKRMQRIQARVTGQPSNRDAIAWYGHRQATVPPRSPPSNVATRLKEQYHGNPRPQSLLGNSKQLVIQRGTLSLVTAEFLFGWLHTCHVSSIFRCSLRGRISNVVQHGAHTKCAESVRSVLFVWVSSMACGLSIRFRWIGTASGFVGEYRPSLASPSTCGPYCSWLGTSGWPCRQP